jgi:hypothetical protein
MRRAGGVSTVAQQNLAFFAPRHTETEPSWGADARSALPEWPPDAVG